MSILIKNVLHHGKKTDVLIEKNRFAKISPRLEAPADKVINGEGKAIVPAFYNTHCHAAMSILRGYGDDKPLFAWLREDIWPIEARLTAADIYTASRLAVLEMIKSGTVFFADMYFFAEETMRAVKEMGIRAAVSLVEMDMFDPAQTTAKIAATKDFLAAENPCPERIVKGLSCHSVYTVSAELLEYASRTAADNNLFMQIHVSETAAENAECVEKYGVTPTARLDSFGLLTNKTMLAHAVHLSAADTETIRARGSFLSHNPVSNLKLNSGLFAFADLYATMPDKITIGTDGASSNNNLSMIESVKTASLAAKLQAGSAVAGKASSISVSDEHSKLGEHSLRWEWKKRGAELSFPGAVPYLPENPNPAETSVSSFIFWVYSAEKLPGELKFTFYKGEKECCSFSYRLGFTGWRGAWVAFDRDMEGTPETGMDRVTVQAPGECRRGVLFFDGVITSAFEDIRHHTPDWQAPFINKDTQSHWLVLNNSWNTSLDITPAEAASEDEIADMELINSRFIELVTPEKKPWSIGRLREMYSSYGISENADGTIKGKPVFFTRYGETYINLGIKDASAQFGRNGQLLKQANDNLLQLAAAWKAEEDPGTKAEIEAMYTGLTRHLLDQGFEAGSGLGTVHHLGYSMRNFYTAPVIMKEVLEKAGLRDRVQAAMEWFSGVGEVKAAPVEPGMDIDAFNTSLMGRVASLLMLEDTPYKAAYMKALSRWVDNGFRYADGTRPCFKTDGSVVHHRKAYPAYATGGFDGAVKAVWMLAGTGFAISEESHGILKQALLEMRFYCNRESFPLAMSGRHPDGKGALIPSQYALLADAGSPDRSEAIDRELASAYMRLDGSGRYGKKFAGAGISAEPAPEGCHVYGYNCSMSHRRGEWLVTFAGHSRYLWSSEIYVEANLYGRYLTHGSMQIMADPQDHVSASGSGFSQEGWDWCHIPGTTAAEIPMAEMRANVLNVDEFSGYEEMLLSDEWFAGGVSHKGMDGVFAMKLHEHDKYNGTLRGLKSFFAFGDRIVALGSGLENRLGGSGLHTTLFQNSMPGSKSQTPVYTSGDSLTVVRDRFGNAFFVKGDNVVYTSGIQHSFHEETADPTEGRFEKAYIDHGSIVDGGSYEYMAVVHASPEKCEEYAAALPYTVVRCDSMAHIVADRVSGEKGFAVFGGLDPEDDAIIEQSTPSLIMYSLGDGELTLSVCNPDLALYSGPSDEVFGEDGKRKERSVYGRTWVDSPCGPSEVRLTLKGDWSITDPGDSSVTSVKDGENTVLVFTTREARTEEITLKMNGQ